MPEILLSPKVEGGCYSIPHVYVWTFFSNFFLKTRNPDMNNGNIKFDGEYLNDEKFNGKAYSE